VSVRVLERAEEPIERRLLYDRSCLHHLHVVGEGLDED